MPKGQLYAVLAHEYIYAWQAENCPKGQSLELKEGFAEWIAYKVLQAFGHDQWADYLYDNRRTGASHYDTGFRRMRTMEQRFGEAYVVKAVQRLRQ